MPEDRRRGEGLVPLGCGAAVAVVVYVLVAPFKCTARGICEGLVAFDHTGHWQAIGAALLVGGVVALLVWLALGADSPRHRAARVIATPLLIVAVCVSALSHSALFIVGPLVGVLVLFLMWTQRPHQRGTEKL